VRSAIRARAVEDARSPPRTTSRTDCSRSIVAFEVGSIDEIAVGAQRMLDAGCEPGWGVGRHVIGSNFFYYARDPWGSFAEYFHDLDHIPEHCGWEPRDFPEQDALYRWGPPLPEYFSHNTELD
jgi:catechol 2,3-dioxygenase